MQFWPPQQEGKHGHSGDTLKGHTDNEGTGLSLLGGKAQRAGTVQSGDKKAQGDLINLCIFLKGKYRGWNQAFYSVSK